MITSWRNSLAPVVFQLKQNNSTEKAILRILFSDFVLGQIILIDLA